MHRLAAVNKSKGTIPDRAAFVTMAISRSAAPTVPAPYKGFRGTILQATQCSLAGGSTPTYQGKAVDVCGGSGPLAGEHLRCQPGGVGGIAGGRCWLMLVLEDHVGQVEIADLDIPAAVNKHVWALHIPVNDCWCAQVQVEQASCSVRRLRDAKQADQLRLATTVCISPLQKCNRFR